MKKMKKINTSVFLFPAALAVVFMASIIIIISPLGSKTLIPIPTPTPVVNLQTYSLKGCGTRHPGFGYNINVPNGWTFYRTENNENGTVYQFLDGNNSTIKINCDTAGIGGVICVNNGVRDNPFKISVNQQDGCYWTPIVEPKVSYGAEYNVKNPYGYFVFTVYGVERTLLDKILSTFKFTP